MALRDIRVLWSMLRGAGRRGSHKERMESLYRGQAEAYDAFRERFLHGRAELIHRIDLPNGGRFVDMGGGTGANLAHLGDRIVRLESVTVVDLCGPLLDMARRRATEKGWKNVRVVEADAVTWKPEGGAFVDAVSFSYSLTMIPDWFQAIENALSILVPGGLLAVIDFHVSRKHPAPGRIRQGAISRAFWRAWFAHDDVFLSPDHVPFLQARTVPLHFEERRGRVPYLPWLRAPYYLYIGRKPSSADVPDARLPPSATHGQYPRLSAGTPGRLRTISSS